MKPRKENYRQKLPHFQQPGQWYSVTVSLEGAIPKTAMAKYSLKLSVAKIIYQNLLIEENLKDRNSDLPSPIDFQTESIVKNFDLGKSKSRIQAAKSAYFTALRNYRLAYDKFLHQMIVPTISLIKPENRKVIEEALHFWEGKKLNSHVWCIMSNHFHWVLTVFEKDEHGDPIYLQDVLHSVKQFTAKRINNAEKREGQLWAHESFETTIRNNEHFVNVFNYVINNPVSAGLVTTWDKWPGTWTEDMDYSKHKMK